MRDGLQEQGSTETNDNYLDQTNVPLLRALWSLLDGIWGVLKGSWGVLVGTKQLKWIHMLKSSGWA